MICYTGLGPLSFADQALGWRVAHGHHRLRGVAPLLEALEGRVAEEFVVALHLCEVLQQLIEECGLREHFRLDEVLVVSLFQLVVVHGELMLGLDEVVERRVDVQVVAPYGDLLGLVDAAAEAHHLRRSVVDAGLPSLNVRVGEAPALWLEGELLEGEHELVAVSRHPLVALQKCLAREEAELEDVLVRTLR